MIKKFLRGASCTMLALLLVLLLIPQPVQAAGASLSGSSSMADLGGVRYVQTQTLAKNALRDTYTLRGYNCWEKNRYETHGFVMQPQR